jgi:hypothetical protein
MEALEMYVLVGHSEIDASRGDESVEFLTAQLLPGISQAPGFVSATFARSADGTAGHSMIVFDNEESARNLVATASDRLPADGPITLISIELCDVVASG